MTLNWLRSCKLSVGGASSKTISGGGQTDLRIVFAIEPSAVQSPNPARFRVYNPSPTTVSALKAKEFTTLKFEAGYKSNTGLIYSGNIKQAIAGHETPVDSYVDIFCGDGDQAYVSSNVNKTLAAGYTPNDKLQVALDAMAPFGITRGLINVDLSQPRYPRGIPLIGMARDLIRDVAVSAGATWSIQNGAVNIVNPNKPIQASTYTMNSATGMIGWPAQTGDGIIVKSLLNANLGPDKLVKIDQSSIIEGEKDNSSVTGPASQQNFNLQNTGLIAADGVYRILYMERRGDTRGQEWFDISTCVAAVGGTPNKQQQETYILYPS